MKTLKIQLPPPIVLFICEDNAALSIMAEAILRDLAIGRVQAASAGDQIPRALNPYALECLVAHGIATTGLRCRRWGQFFGLDRPPVRVVITLADVYAKEANWSHAAVRTVKAHWPMPDLEAITSSGIDIRLAFEVAFATLHRRIGELLKLPVRDLNDESLASELARIGKMP